MCVAESECPTVLITGSSTGIGAACAFELDRRNYRVFAGVRREADGQKLREKASTRLTPLLIDVTDAGSIRTAAETVGQTVGEAGLDGLVNNAGIVVAGPLEVLPIEELRKQLEVNLIGQIAVTQAFLPMLRTARGRIVNMGSISGWVASPYLGAYAASKHALEAVTDSLRIELRNWGIRVAIIEPGPVVTPIWEKSLASSDELAERMPPEAERLYGEDTRALRKMTEQLGKNGMPVELVVRAVVHALSARRPKTRYPVNWYTRLSIAVLKRVPDRLRDRLVLWELRLP